ncbi:hypothetical protein [Lactovum miscens]|uniref:Uncharacterized protein n=1 Tax=Lactovum miscens TaxID=190387 RepID=A0A841C6V5_9LACT|nr:hypothetical protein [Lactovum miscens]MBB5888017.1 hypothetical protein [Lactovum miscens]
MSKFWKFGLGLAVGAAAGAGLYMAYQKNEDDLRRDLVDAVRTHFDLEEIDVVWLFDEPIREGVFAGGLNLSSGKSISFEIEEKSQKIIKEEKEEIVE